MSGLGLCCSGTWRLGVPVLRLRRWLQVTGRGQQVPGAGRMSVAWCHIAGSPTPVPSGASTDFIGICVQKQT